MKWLKRTGILVGILLYLVTALVAFVVAIVAAALALLPLVTLLAMGLYLKIGSDRLRPLISDPKVNPCPDCGSPGLFFPPAVEGARMTIFCKNNVRCPGDPEVWQQPGETKADLIRRWNALIPTAGERG
jgi:hypothetical protein